MRYPAAKLESLARDFLEATGSSEDEARVVAEHIPSLEIRVAQTLAALIFEPLFEYSSVGVM